MLTFWNDFLALSNKRGKGDCGFLPITFSEIEAWARLQNITVSQYWLDVIEMLDWLWLSVNNK